MLCCEERSDELGVLSSLLNSNTCYGNQLRRASPRRLRETAADGVASAQYWSDQAGVFAIENGRLVQQVPERPVEWSPEDAPSSVIGDANATDYEVKVKFQLNEDEGRSCKGVVVQERGANIADDENEEPDAGLRLKMNENEEPRLRVHPSQPAHELDLGTAIADLSRAPHH